MSKALKCVIQSTDPGYPNDASAVTKSTTKTGTGDRVVVSALETGNNAARNAVVVLKVNSGANPTVTTDANGGVVLTASNTGVTSYLLVELATSEPNNWTVNLNTSGASNYIFKKGNGGGGRKH
ncbi:MAG TPA: hypothetical protein PK760_03105 [Flavobacteriales bacterium]|nr:hypothetical protein [Flavobacteriales bacterium]